MSSPPESADGPRGLDLDAGRLAAFLKGALDVPPGELSVERLGGGQSNPTYLLRFDGRPAWVLRRKPPGTLLPSAHAVDREFRVMGALADSGVPVPRMLLCCDDETVVGTAFFVMDHVAGRTVWDPALPGVGRSDRGRIYDDVIRVLARLHAVDPAAVGLADFGRPGNYYARQIDRWTRQYRASETGPIADMDALIAWLPAHIPAGDEVSIVHGDYRLDNLILDPLAPRVIAVIDWELSTLGHPLADLAYHVMGWRMPADLRGLAGIDLAALGIPAEQDYVAAYLRHAGRTSFDRRAWEFAIAYNLFRVAAIRQGVLKRGLEGNAASERALEAGARARQAARLGWQTARRIGAGDA